ncbi:MAG: hypothetical protein ACK4ND_15020 [Cytophagaceae bacterium]
MKLIFFSIAFGIISWVLSFSIFGVFMVPFTIFASLAFYFLALGENNLLLKVAALKYIILAFLILPIIPLLIYSISE